MSGESLPSGVLKVADLLIEARIEGDSRYTLRTSAVAFAKGAEFALNIARRYLASPPPQATGALSDERIMALADEYARRQRHYINSPHADSAAIAEAAREALRASLVAHKAGNVSDNGTCDPSVSHNVRAAATMAQTKEG